MTQAVLVLTPIVAGVLVIGVLVAAEVLTGRYQARVKDRRSARQRAASRRLYETSQPTARVQRPLPPEEKP